MSGVTYRCGTCQSEVLVIEAFPKLDEMPATWVLTCGNAHVVVPVPGTRWVIYGGQV